jgi:hypothetical protein
MSNHDEDVDEYLRSQVEHYKKLYHEEIAKRKCLEFQLSEIHERLKLATTLAEVYIDKKG